MKRIDSPHFRGLPQRRLLAPLLALALGAAPLSAATMSDGNYLSDGTLPGGGAGTMSAGGFVLVGGLGEAIVGAAGNGSQQLTAGFMAGVSGDAGGASSSGSSSSPAASSGSSTPPVPTLISAPAHVETALTGTTPVNAASGSTLTIPSGATVAGTAITLAAPAAGKPVEPVTLKIGGVTLSVTPSGADSVVTLKKVMLNGVETPVLAITSGSISVSAPAGQALLALNNGVTVSAGDTGGALSASSDGNRIAVTGGYIVLPVNAFAQSNGFATIRDGKVYAGEIAEFDSTGKVKQVRLGSPSGSDGALGDPLTMTAVAGVTVKAVSPTLTGKSARISATQDYADALLAQLDKGTVSQGQGNDGALRFAIAGGTLNLLPLGQLTVDTSRPDGITFTASGTAEVVTNGVVASFAPALADLGQFAGQLAKLDRNATLTLKEDGALQIALNNQTYLIQPAWLSDQENATVAGFATEASGWLVFRDAGGKRQVLYPRFADLARLVAIFQTLDGQAQARTQGDGTTGATFQGSRYTLVPDYQLTPVPAAQAGKEWWLEGAKLFINNRDGSAQGFRVK